jgi:hypothetical protein
VPGTFFLAAAVVGVLLAMLPARAEASPTMRLPWPAGQAVIVTQDCNDSCCNDHVGHNAYAWDFAVPGEFEVLATRAGTLTHVKMSSNRGGGVESVDAANYIVIEHGDGTSSVFLHLAYGSLDPALRCGEFVRAGQRLAITGSTGWSTGNHLHYQVNRIPPVMPQVCECGPEGMGCAEDEPHWELFWSNRPASQTMPVQFEEWPEASSCNDRHEGLALVSRNVDAREEVITIDEAEPQRFVPLTGRWLRASGGVRGGYHHASGEAAARVSFEGRIGRPGLFEIWTALPAPGRHVGTSTAVLEIVSRGQRSAIVQAQNVAGGGYRRLPGVYKLTGREGEGVVFSTQGRTGEALAVDAIVLRRVSDSRVLRSDATCATSAQCADELVCMVGQCRPGCEASPCGEGERCDPTGLCVREGGARVASASEPKAPASAPTMARVAPASAAATAEVTTAPASDPATKEGAPSAGDAPEGGKRPVMPRGAWPERGPHWPDF